MLHDLAESMPQVEGTPRRSGHAQAELEQTLFAIMEEAGFAEEYVQRYKLVSGFFRQRRPLIVQLCGAPCTGAASTPCAAARRSHARPAAFAAGKSTIAQMLASSFNLPNVLQTDIFYEVRSLLAVNCVRYPGEAAQGNWSCRRAPVAIPSSVRVQLLQATDGQLGGQQAVWARPDSSDAELVAAYREQCRLVRMALDGDLVKVPCPAWGLR